MHKFKLSNRRETGIDNILKIFKNKTKTYFQPNFIYKNINPYNYNRDIWNSNMITRKEMDNGALIYKDRKDTSGGGNQPTYLNNISSLIKGKRLAKSVEYARREFFTTNKSKVTHVLESTVNKIEDDILSRIYNIEDHNNLEFELKNIKLKSLSLRKRRETGAGGGSTLSIHSRLKDKLSKFYTHDSLKPFCQKMEESNQVLEGLSHTNRSIMRGIRNAGNAFVEEIIKKKEGETFPMDKIINELNNNAKSMKLIKQRYIKGEARLKKIFEEKEKVANRVSEKLSRQLTTNSAMVCDSIDSSRRLSRMSTIKNQRLRKSKTNHRFFIHLRTLRPSETNLDRIHHFII